MITMLTPQQIFDKIVMHLREQRLPARGKGDYACSYRTRDGLKCAIGCLIPDEKYDPDIERAGPPKPSWKITSERDEASRRLHEILRSEGVDLDNDTVLNLCLTMQKIHDRYITADWEPLFARTAEKYGLTYPAS